MSQLILMFSKRAYSGPLTQLEQLFLHFPLRITTSSSRVAMEYDAAANLVSFVNRGVVSEKMWFYALAE